MIKSKIVLTGGPCAGKTTIINKIKECVDNVIIVEETATFLFKKGLVINQNISLENFQKLMILVQFYKELEYEKKAIESDENIIILCDRGILDSGAYIEKSKYLEYLKEFKVDYKKIIEFYDKIIYLETVAITLPEKYMEERLNSNETFIDAINLGDKTLNMWKDLFNLNIIKSSDVFLTKYNQVFDMIINDTKNNDNMNKIKIAKKYIYESDRQLKETESKIKKIMQVL